MPNRLITYLGSTFGTLVAVYITLVITTVYFASVQTDLLSSVSNTEAAIGTLETKYYVAIDQISSIDPSTLGFVAPEKKAFARAANAPTLTLTGN